MWLPDSRREWAEAMTAELEQLDGRLERWRFALGACGLCCSRREAEGGHLRWRTDRSS